MPCKCLMLAETETQMLKIGPMPLLPKKTLQIQMVGAVAGESVAGDSIDRLQQLKVFDSGVTRIPPIFVIPPE